MESDGIGNGSWGNRSGGVAPGRSDVRADRAHARAGWERAAWTWILGFAIAIGAMASPSLAQCVEWLPLDIRERTEAAMAYDAARDRIVLFGGAAGTGELLGDTIEWDGLSWLIRTDAATGSGPSRRTGAAMAYDAARERIVLFGGLGEGGYSGQTWTWDGVSWSLATEAGPSGRAGHAMVYDSARQVVVMFGGRTNATTLSRETWEWDGTAWTMRSSVGPAAREWHAMAFDPARARTVLHGGRSASGVMSATWEWDGTSWLLRDEAGFGPRERHAMVFDPAMGQVVAFGGSSPQGTFADTWAWNGTSWTPRTLPLSPTARFGHTMATRLVDQRIVLFGGNDGEARADAWLLDPAGWGRFRIGDRPGPRVDAGVAWDSDRRVLVVYGGSDAGNGEFVTWEWERGEWRRLQTPFAPDGGEAMVYDRARRVCVLFTGSQTWEWDGAVWTPRKLDEPPARTRFGMTYDPVHDRTLLAAGEGTTDRTVWSYDGTAWQISPPLIPFTISGARAVYLEHRDALFLQDAGAVHTRAGTAWTSVGVPLGVARTANSLVYSPPSRRAVMHGGSAITDRNLYEWDGLAFGQVQGSSPTALAGHRMVYDETEDRFIMFGGQNVDLNLPTNALWQLTFTGAPAITMEPESGTVRAGATFDLRVATDSPTPATYQWRHNGVDLVDGGRISGATTEHLVITDAARGDAGPYECAVQNACSGVNSLLATIFIRCPGDLTGSAVVGHPGYGVPDGVVNTEDMFYFIQQYAAGNVAVADLTGTAFQGQPGYGVPNGVLNTDDFFFLLQALVRGC